MRVFVAIELEERVKEYLEEKKKIVQNYSLGGNFSRKENLHLTLRFIGEVEVQGVEQIKKAMQETASQSKPFILELGKLGEFPRGNKKILWIGIRSGQEILQQLFEKMEMNLEKKGFEREAKGLKPHITLGREIRIDKPLREIDHELDLKPKEIAVRKISLMESKRIEGTLRYIPIYTENLE